MSSPAREEQKPELHIQPFPYMEAGGTAAQHSVRGMPHDFGVAPPSDASRREAALREEGRQEGEARARQRYEQELEGLRQSVRGAIGGFAQDRATYFQKVEKEIVQLALSIARKILHRESQVDPFLLAGIARVALDQIETNTKVTLRVHPRHAADARLFFASCMEADRLPEIIEDSTLDLERFVLQTGMGNTEVGLEVQMKEVEQGLLDLMSQRPQAGV